jgi:hypothetical protein
MTWDWATEWYDYVMIQVFHHPTAIWRAEFHLIGFSR